MCGVVSLFIKPILLQSVLGYRHCMLAGEGIQDSEADELNLLLSELYTEKLMIESLFCSILVIFAKSACADGLHSSLYLIIAISSRKG